MLEVILGWDKHYYCLSIMQVGIFRCYSIFSITAIFWVPLYVIVLILLINFTKAWAYILLFFILLYLQINLRIFKKIMLNDYPLKIDLR